MTITSSWTPTTLGECADWYSGGTPKTSVPEYWNGDIPWITASSLHDFYIRDSDRRITPLGVKNGTRLVPKNTILFVVRGMSLKTEFRVGISCRPVAFGQDCKALIPKEGVDPLFLANVLRGRAKEILELADEASHGTGRLATDALKRFELCLPPLDEQRKIAYILGTLDDKIELNQQMNQTLEGIAHAIFKSWFIDFDPVRAKLDHRQPVGMDAETAALFPDSFEESPLGKIPKGWNFTSLKSVTSYLKRGVQPKYLDDGGVLVINQKCIRDHRLSFDKARRHDSKKRTIEGREVQFGDILVNSTGVGTLGRVAQILHLTESTIVDSHVTVVRVNPRVTTIHYLGFTLLGREKEIEALGEGSTGQTELSRTMLGAIDILVPPISIQRHFDQQVAILRQKVVSNEMQSLTLESTRNVLLPNLVSCGKNSGKEKCSDSFGF